MNLLEIVVSKGGFIMLLIAVSAIWALALIIERLVYLRRVKIDVQEFMERIRNLLVRSTAQEAIEYCKKNTNILSGIILAGLEKYEQKKGKADIKEAIENKGNETIFLLENRLGILATLGAITPTMGFLGTVTGMISAFREIQAKSGNVDASVLAGGIWEALLTTAAGLIISIPIVLMYNYFTGRIERFVYYMEKSSNQLVDILETRESDEVELEVPVQPDEDEEISETEVVEEERKQ